MQRSLKIQANIIPSRSYRKIKIYPKIILSGKWLLDAGFSPDSIVNVTVQNNSLTINLNQGGAK